MNTDDHERKNNETWRSPNGTNQPRKIGFDDSNNLEEAWRPNIPQPQQIVNGGSCFCNIIYYIIAIVVILAMAC